MFAMLLANLASKMPSSLKYKMAGLRPLYASILRFGQSTAQVETSAGRLRWKIDSLSSQEFLRGTYEPYMQEAFHKYIKPGDTIFDVGAHAGFHSMFCGLLVGATGEVFAFEPNAISRESLSRQIAANPSLKVLAIPRALSDVAGWLAFDQTRGAESRILRSAKTKVQVDTLDDLVKAGFPVPALIKIDVEGSELEVLRGGIQMLTKYRPIILCDYNGSDTPALISEVLLPLGYQILPGPPVVGISK